MIRPISCSAAFALGLRVVGEPSLELAQDRIPGVAANADDEGKAEFLPVGGVEPAEAVELLGAEPVEAEPALFGLGMAGQVGAFDPAAELRVAADEGQLPLGRGPPDRLHHGVVQCRDGRVGPAGGGGLGHPGGVFEHFAQCRDKGGSGQAVEAGKGLGGAASLSQFYARWTAENDYFACRSRGLGGHCIRFEPNAHLPRD